MEVAAGRHIGGGRFEVLARIGEGAAGVVYAVKDRQSDSRLALKTVRRAGPEDLASLKHEFRAVQDITHPNLVRLDELYEDEGLWFFTMELVDGKDWLSYVRPDGRAPDVPALRATLVQIVEALVALHAKGLVHRDVKPTNVLVSAGGQVKILDFGIASAARTVDPSMEGVIVGTLAYMPPEQLLAEQPRPDWDFYAVGAMLYQALTGELPYADRRGHLWDAKLQGPPTPVREVDTAATAPPLPDDLADLCDALLRSDASDRPNAEGILHALGIGVAPSGKHAIARETFVGRRAELAALRDASNAVAEGHPVAVLVEGPSGVGKSALVRHFLDELEGEALVFQGRCHEREYVPYKGIDAIVDDLSEYLFNDDDESLFSSTNSAMRLLPRLFPVLKGVPFFARIDAGSLSLAEGDASELRARIFGAFRELVTQVAKRQRLVLAVDDVQWADGDSLALLGDLLAPPSPPPLLLVCTRRFSEGETAADREGPRASVPSPIALPGDLRVVRLGGLTDDEMTSLASHLSTDADLGEAEVRVLAKESGGHPLFLQELMRSRARGAGGAHGETQLRLDDALWQRVLRLEPTERSLVEATAVAGVPTSLELIASAAGIDRRGLADHTAQLRGASLVKFSGTSAKRRIEPYHDRVREAVLRNLGDEALRAWHERLARVLDASAGRDVERLALHWEGAGDAPRAATLLRQAGDRASQALAFDHAVELYRRSRALAGPSKELDLALAEALFNAGQGRDGGTAFLALAERETDRTALELRVRAANSFFGSGYFDEGVDAIRGVLRAVGLGFPKGRLSVILSILWRRLRIRLRGFELAARDPASVPAQELLRFDACTAAGFGLGMADTVRGQSLQFLAARLALDLGDPRRAARALCGFALGLSSGGVSVAKITAAAIAKARELAKDLGDPYLDGLVSAASGFATFMIDEWVQAEEFLRAGEEAFRNVRGASYELSTCRMMRGRALLQLGRLTDLAVYQGPSLRDAIRRNDVYAISNTQATVSALLALAHDDVALAESEVAAALKLLSGYSFKLQHVYCIQAGCTMDLYRGAPEGVLARLEENGPALRASLFERVQSIRVSFDSLRGRAHLALAERSAQGRGDHLARAATAARRLGKQRLPVAAAHGQLLRAGVAGIAGDKEAAARLLRSAIAGFDDRAIALHAAAARLALARLATEDEARQLTATAMRAFEDQGVVAPERYAAHYAPGFGLRGESHAAKKP